MSGSKEENRKHRIVKIFISVRVSEGIREFIILVSSLSHVRKVLE